MQGYRHFTIWIDYLDCCTCCCTQSASTTSSLHSMSSEIASAWTLYPSVNVLNQIFARILATVRKFFFLSSRFTVSLFPLRWFPNVLSGSMVLAMYGIVKPCAFQLDWMQKDLFHWCNANVHPVPVL